jgi:parallel beta-helix repeat protein
VSSNGSGTDCTNSNPCSLSYFQSDDSTDTKHIKLGPGDNLYLKGGTYNRQSILNFSSSGTAVARITISTAPGEPTKAVISGDINGNSAVDETDGPRTLDSVLYHKWTPLVRISGSYITFKDIEIDFSSGRGIQTEGSHNILTGLNVHHTWSSAIHIFGPNTLIVNNTVWRGAESNYCGGLGGGRMCNGDWGGGIAWGEAGGAASPGISNHITVRGNTVYNNSGEGIICMHTDYSVVENNVVYDNWGLGIDLDKCGYAIVQKNLIYYTVDTQWWRKTDLKGNPIRPASGILISNEYTKASGNTYPLGHDRKIVNNIIVGAGSGITFWPGDGSDGEFDRSRLINDVIAHNTLVEAQNNGTGITIMRPPLAGLAHTNTRIANNIILQSSGTMAKVDTAAGLTFDHNIWSRIPSTNVQGVGDIYADPQLAILNHTRIPGSVVDACYKLSASSPAINAGAILAGVSTDYWDNPRDNSADIGAYEYAFTTPLRSDACNSRRHKQ